MNKLNIHPTYVQIHATKEVYADIVEAFDNVDFGTPRLECYRDKFGLAAMKAGNYTYLVTDTRMSIS